MTNEHNRSSKDVAYLPKDVSDVDIAFGSIDGLMPARADIGEPPRWARDLFNAWFCCGLKSLELVPKAGIDRQKALRHIRAIMGSFSPKHEDKEDAVAFYLGHWFESAKYEPKELKL